MGFIQLIIGIALLPLVTACVVNVYTHVLTYPTNYGNYFIYGMATFLGIFLFFYQFWKWFEFGQKVTAGIFKFLSPFDRLVANLIPFYFSIVIIVFFIEKSFFKSTMYDLHLMFLAGFSLALHVLLVSSDQQNNETSPMKSSYLLLMCFVIIFNAFYATVLLDLIFDRFQLAQFSKAIYLDARYYYIFLFKKIMFFQ